jgi:hypothetical protein
MALEAHAWALADVAWDEHQARCRLRGRRSARPR